MIIDDDFQVRKVMTMKKCIQDISKVELHCHLDGSSRLSHASLTIKLSSISGICCSAANCLIKPLLTDPSKWQCNSTLEMS